MCSGFSFKPHETALKRILARRVTVPKSQGCNVSNEKYILNHLNIRKKTLLRSVRGEALVEVFSPFHDPRRRVPSAGLERRDVLLREAISGRAKAQFALQGCDVFVGKGA